MRSTLILWLALAVLLSPKVWGANPASTLALHVGDSDALAFDGMTTASTGDPAVADIVPLSTRRLLINAKGAGHTTIIVLDRRGKHLVRVTVAALGSVPEAVAAQIEKDIGLPTVTARVIHGVVFLEGVVPTEADGQRAQAIADVYAPQVKDLLAVVPPQPAQSEAATYAALINETWDGQGIAARVMDAQTIALTGTYTPPPDTETAAPEPEETDDTSSADDAPPPPSRRSRAKGAQESPLDRMLATLPKTLTVVNLVQTGSRPVQQILVRAKVIDIDRDSVNQLGVQWGSVGLSLSDSGRQYVLQSQPILFGQAPSSPYNNLVGGGPITRLQPLGAALNALITENKARVLSEPSLLVRDGAEGSMLVGGEIPVPVAQSSDGYGGATVSVEYKPYGVRLRVQPTVVASDTIELTATPEVSELDYGNGVSFNNLSIPALTVRRATSTLQLRDGATLVIGGLYNNSSQRQVQRIPLLSQIPILGEFFKYTSTRKQENELLILLSVEIVRPDSPDVQPPAPGSPENPGIGKPDVPRNAFDGDFPDIANLGRPDHDAPKAPVNLPPVPAGGSGPP